MDVNEDNAVVKRTASLVSLEPQREKGLVARGLKDIVSQKTILFVYRTCEPGVHLLFDEELGAVLGATLRVIHCYSARQAFDCLISSKVDLVVSEIRLDDEAGFELMEASKTLYPQLPFIIYCAYSKYSYGAIKPDYHIQLSCDFSELMKTVDTTLSANQSTAVMNCQLKRGDNGALLNLGRAHVKLRQYQQAIESYTRVIDNVDSELFQAGITIAGYHVERGARTFSAYVKAMVDDLGNTVIPHLKQWYWGLKFDTRAGNLDMDGAAEVETADVSAILEIEGIDPYSVDDTVYYELGVLWLKVGQKGKAFEIYQILKGLNSGLAGALSAEIYK